MLRLGAGDDGHQQLWFDIQKAIAELQRICVGARAVELLNLRRQAEASGFEGIVETGAASAVPELSCDARFRDAEAMSKGPAFIAKHPPGSGVDVVSVRSQLRKQLTWLKGRLGEELTEREVYNGLFPIVIYTDELVHVATDGASNQWEPLQGELYDVDNGGEVFFSSLETLLQKSDTHPIIFEIYYFCLRDGFVGQFHGQPGRIEEYCQRLAEHIPLSQGAPHGQADTPTTPVTLLPFPVRSYIVAVAAVLAVWLGLRSAANYEVGQEARRVAGASDDERVLQPEEEDTTP